MELVITVSLSFSLSAFGYKNSCGTGIKKNMVAFLYQRCCYFCHFLFSAYILVFSDIKGQVNAYILFYDSSAIAFGGQSFFFQLVEVTAYSLFRYLIELTEFADYDPFLCLEFLKDQVPPF